MTVAAFILGLLGFGVGVASLTWQIISFLLQGARPKLTPIVGMLTARGVVTNDATRDVRESLRSAAAQLPPGPLIIGVKVVNAGRAPFHVARWELRADPLGASFKVLDDPIGSRAIPCDIQAGAEEIFFARMDNARALASGCEAIEGETQRIVVTVSSGGRTYVTKPVHPALLTLEQQ